MKVTARAGVWVLAVCLVLMAIPAIALSEEFPFEDVQESQWYYDAVRYVYEKELMLGTGENTFSPDGVTSRGMVVTLLHRLEGTPAAAGQMFADVPSGAYYEQAITWAANHRIVEGYGGGTFGPDDAITREQLAAILYRYADYKGWDVSAAVELNAFSDGTTVSGYALVPVKWAVAEGLIAGASGNKLVPQGNALRAQTAAILMRFCEAVIPGETSPTTGETPAATPSPVVTPSPTTGETPTATPSPVVTPSPTAGETPAATPSPTATLPPETDDTFALAVGNVSAGSGDTEVVVPVVLRNNPGMLGMILTVSYEENVMSLVNAESGEAVEGVLQFTAAGKLQSGCNFLWDGLDLTDSQIRDGTLLLLTFHISEDAPAGSYPISVIYQDGNVVDRDLQPLSPAIQNGSLTISP